MNLIDNLNLTVVIPTKNEENCIADTVNELKNLDYTKILIIDANSDDKTIEIGKNLGCECVLQKGKGYGQAVIESLDYIKTEYVCFFDADYSYNPRSIKEMHKKLMDENLDIVFGSRYKNNSKSEDDTFIRYLGNKFFTTLCNLLFGTKISDCLFHYPVAKLETYKELKLSYNDFSLCFEVPAKVHYMHYKYSEVLSKERKRISGVSKVNALFDGLKILINIFKLKINLIFGGYGKN